MRYFGNGFKISPYKNFEKYLVSVVPDLLGSLKGEYEDYTWGYHRNPVDYTLPSVPISISFLDPIFSYR